MTTFDLTKYLGSGVLIVDTTSSSLLLVYDYTENYNCCGGYIKYDLDDPLRIEKTAIEELSEETRTLIPCDLNRLRTCPFVDLDFHDDIFRCYILKIPCSSDICEKFEEFVVNLLPTADDYSETTRLTFFPLKQFRKKKSMLKIIESSKAKNHLGEVNPLNQRVISVINASAKQNLL
jgi:hypothetical protein